MKPLFDLVIDTDGWPDEDQLSRIITAVLNVLVTRLAIGPERTICFLFTDDRSIAELNGRFRGKPKPTNVLSFPAHDLDADELGNIAMGRETLSREAAEKSISLEDHIAHLVVHGVLHLLGYDHENELEAETMESIERETLSLVGISDPYQGDRI